MTRLRNNKIIICVLLLFIVLFFCAVMIDVTEKHEKEVEEEFKPNIDVVIPEKIYVANEAIVEWMNGNDTAKNIFDKYRPYGVLDYTKSIELLYTIENIPLDCKIENQYITLKDKDYSKLVSTQNLPSEKRSVSFENLRPDTVYEYLIQVVFSNGKKIEKIGDFKTEPSSCFLFVDGARNVRDIGTTKTIDGRQIKKYMFYRGTELDGAIEPDLTITPEGRDYMRNVLNIKTELDLRWYDEKTMKDALGTDVRHVYHPVSIYNDFFEEDYSVISTKEIFSELANHDAYPVYLHCSFGADRTGTIVYVLEALLGVDEKTLYREWECSVFCHGDSFYEDMEKFFIRFKSLEGNTMQEKAENYLLSIGVTQQEIESIREILLTD